MKKFRTILTSIIILLGSLSMWAQEVIVTITPKQEVLPPQILLYVADPGKYFNISLTNTTNDVQNVYLSLRIDQITPVSSEFSAATPAHRQPKNPFTIQANSTYQLSTVEMKKLFDHIPSSEMQLPNEFFTNFQNGSFGLLPEGRFKAQVTAYRWNQPQYPNPVAVSSPEGGWCTFVVCYKAQAPQFLSPMITNVNQTYATIDPLNPMFTWTMPTINCSSFSSYTYDFKVVEILDGQQPDVAMDRNPVVFQSKGLLSNMCLIPLNIITTKFYANKKYLAQVTAKPKTTGSLDYVMIENNGKSTYCMFQMNTGNAVLPEPEQPKASEPEEDPKQGQEPEEEPSDSLILLWGKTGVQDSLYNDALYSFRNPTITTPAFEGFGARKMFLRSDIAVSWKEVWHLGGEGLEPDTLKFDYEVELFNGKDVADKEQALQGQPIYRSTIKGGSELTDTIRWEQIGDNISEKDYLVLRVKPICTNAPDSAVVFHYDSLNTVDFAIVEFLSKKYFQCSNMVEIDNETPISATAEDLKGKVVAIGEYELTIDDIKSGKGADTWEGKGRVEWNPLGTKVMVCVKFEDLKINTDYVVYAGTAQSYSNDKNSNNDIVEKLFSDWGIDNYISDATIPYAEHISQNVKDKAKGLAEELDLSKYYEYVVVGQNAWNAIGKQNIDELYMPIALPKEITAKSPVNVQITTMKFAPTHATMDLIGEFVLPNSSVTKDQILVFGCPRLCISPNSVLPESGTLALLSDLTLYDTKSDFTFTFNAPDDPIYPTNGCYVSWHANAFEMLSFDADMTIPELRVDSMGVMTERCPKLHVSVDFSEWEDWMVPDVSIEPFQIVDHPGWTFTAQNIVYDHSIHRNSSYMGAFPDGYDMTKVVKDGDILKWKGLHIGEISVLMPGALTFGDAKEERGKISATNMFFDDSGATLTVSGEDVLSAKTAKAGGWSFELDYVSLNFIQNNFNDCYFKGKFDVPLINSEIGYKCQIQKVNSEHNKAAGDYAYIFTTQQVEGSMDFDFFVAKADITKELTYLLVEAVPGEEEELQTRVELLLGGSLSIGGKEYLQNFVDDLDLDFQIPDVHFAKMRLANCDRWESKYEKELQDAANTEIKDALLDLYKDKQFKWGGFYFNTGDWSLASEEKHLGPFSFSLSDYDFSYKNNELSVYLQGTIKFVESIEMSASAGLEIQSTVSGIEEMDFSKISVKYKDVLFRDASLKASFGGMKIEGTLSTSNDSVNGKGYAGALLLSIPGDLFVLDAKGGYYERPDFSWGYFDLSLSGQGLRVDPIVISGVHGGFYFNCVKKSAGEDSSQFTVTPKDGVIGVILGITISTSAGEDALKGTFEMTVAYDSKNDKLTTFMFTGDLKAIGGLVDAKATILYENTDADQYFALNITIEAGLSGDKALESVMGEGMSELAGKLSELNDKFQSPVGGITAGLEDLGDKSETKADLDDEAEAAQAKAEKELEMTVGDTSITIDLRITMKEEGKKLDKVKWHLYIGQPDEDLRCKFTLINFKSPLLSVNIGANAYLCLGNELPNNGELPQINARVQQFLDGSTKGAGVKSDDMNKANRMRTRALENFKAEVSGGIMLGASAWGFVDLDLGLFYGKMEAIGGFDISLRHMTGLSCMNFDKEPGYHGWYGEGQIYAYLAAALGLKLDLGFWSGEFPILNAGIGGVFRMGGINPNYFTGAARVKLQAFGGLVDVNRKFEFECGDVCDIFYGNALDDFELFEECTLGDTVKSNGWGDAFVVDPYLDTKPAIITTAPIDEHFRIIDETEYQRMLRDWEGDAEKLKSQANRTFVFHTSEKAMLYEYNSKNSSRASKITYVPFDLNESFRTRHTLSLYNLSPDKYYCLEVQGYAKELYEGVEDDPQTYNESKRQYEPKPWLQTRKYYFRTNSGNSVPLDSMNLQDYVALAYPSSYGELTTPEGYLDTAYVSDVTSPIISLKRDISNTYFHEDLYKFLQWSLCDENGKELETRPNSWVTEGGICVMTPQTPFTKVQKNKNYYLRLKYFEYGLDTVTVVTEHEVNKNKTVKKTASATINEGKTSGESSLLAMDNYANNRRTANLPAPMDETSAIMEQLFADYEILEADMSVTSPQVRMSRKSANANQKTDTAAASRVISNNKGLSSNVPNVTGLNKYTSASQEEPKTLEGVKVQKESHSIENLIEKVTKTEQNVQLVLKKEMVLMNLKVRAVEGSWNKGYVAKNGKRTNTNYEMPFLGIRTKYVWFNHTNDTKNNNYQDEMKDARLSEYPGTKYGSTPYRLYDPYWYISYLSNYAFIGGRRLQADKIGVQATTTQSLIYTDLGGVYEGFTEGGSESYRIKNELPKVRENSIYIPNQTHYPLPIMEYDLHAYREGGDRRIPIFKPSDSYVTNVENALQQLRDVHEAAHKMNEQIKIMAKNVDDFFVNSTKFSIAEWVKQRTGVNLTVTSGNVKLEVPYYQFGVLWGSQYENKGNTKNVALKTTIPSLANNSARADLKLSQDIWLSMCGRGILNHKVVKRTPDNYPLSNKNYIDWITYDIYRVNVYNVNTRKYEVRWASLPKAQQDAKFEVKIANPVGNNPSVTY